MGKAEVIREMENNKALSGYLFIRGFLVTDMDGLDLSGLNSSRTAEGPLRQRVGRPFY